MVDVIATPLIPLTTGLDCDDSPVVTLMAKAIGAPKLCQG